MKRWEAYLEQKLMCEGFFDQLSNIGSDLSKAGKFVSRTTSSIAKGIEKTGSSLKKYIQKIDEKLKDKNDKEQQEYAKNRINEMEIKLLKTSPEEKEFNEILSEMISWKLWAKNKKYIKTETVISNAIEDQYDRKAEYYIDLHKQSKNSKNSPLYRSELENIIKQLDLNSSTRSKILRYLKQSKDEEKKYLSLRKYGEEQRQRLLSKKT